MACNEEICGEKVSSEQNGGLQCSFSTGLNALMWAMNQAFWGGIEIYNFQ